VLSVAAAQRREKSMASKSPDDNSQEKLPRYRDHGGYLVAGGFPIEGFSSALKYQARDDDLFIVTYPKVSLFYFFPFTILRIPKKCCIIPHHHQYLYFL
jgi:hypothetical protein